MRKSAARAGGPEADPAGGLVGAGAGALSGGWAGPFAILTAPDAALAIEKIDIGMSCLFGQQEYWVAIQWRTTEAGSTRSLNWTTRRCTVNSPRDVDEWFAHPDEAQAELEQALAATGRRMSAQWLADEQLPRECVLQAGATRQLETQ